MHHLGDRHNPKGHCKRQVCLASLVVSLVYLDSTLSFFLMTSVVAILFSVAQRLNIRLYLPAEGKSNDPLHHLMVVCGHPYSSGRSIPQPHACCFYEHVRPSRGVDAWDVAHECTILKFLHHHRIASGGDERRRQHRLISRKLHCNRE